MTLPSSGIISLNAINTELGKTPTSQISLNDSDVRGLLAKASGQISLADGFGKSKAVASGGRIVVGYHSDPTPDQFTTFNTYGYSSGQDYDYFPFAIGSASPAPIPVKTGITCAVIVNFYNGFIGTNESYVSLSGSVGNSFILRNLTYGGDTMMNFQAVSGNYYHYVGALVNGLDNEGASLQFTFLNTAGGAL